MFYNKSDKLVICKAGFLILLFLIAGCSGSTGSRYSDDKSNDKKEDKSKTGTEKKISVIKPDFDMTAYHSRFEFKMTKKNPEKIWYGYDTTKMVSEDTLVTDSAGYRVEVLATDNLEEAKTLKSDIYFRLKEEVYIIFDSPFYKVRVGDFISRTDAENESFKLKQLGYGDARVVSDSIKVKGIR